MAIVFGSRYDSVRSSNSRRFSGMIRLPEFALPRIREEVFGLRYCCKQIPHIRSINGMVHAMAFLRDQAKFAGKLGVVNNFDSAIYYLSTCRLSATTCLAIMADLKTVFQWLLKHKPGATTEVGDFLHTYDEE